MAVGFFADDGEEHLNSSYHTTVMTSNSATQTPLQSPVTREYLVSAFCEALNRCAVAGKLYTNFPIFFSICDFEEYRNPNLSANQMILVYFEMVFFFFENLSLFSQSYLTNTPLS